MENGIEQKPTPPNEWLYEVTWIEEELEQKENREFFRGAYLPDGKEPYPECTNQEKEDWEHDHQPQPEQAQETQQ